MKVDSAFSSGLSGIQAGQKNMRNAAQDIAEAGTTKPNADVASPLVELKTSQIQIEASTKSVKAADEALGSLIDTLA
ncbi:hypothetical protein MIB92_04680 [Aestuariirhabdus sp. Z084]|uniref:hypothetical protein n=1 Tax=Aestuariirhabdus haliotis TaxID=2918751 RepID=UPI00201B3983|nr:hypothetical protein [Aestuariirhabdus haliotis]MCL6414935.1 hypothetical protein [Aestuariirhabdus haliotis]MCL6418867.1 hypothetical protein [Aestuariirhabdus haliotis]